MLHACSGEIHSDGNWVIRISRGEIEKIEQITESPETGIRTFRDMCEASGVIVSPSDEVRLDKEKNIVEIVGPKKLYDEVYTVLKNIDHFVDFFLNESQFFSEERLRALENE